MQSQKSSPLAIALSSLSPAEQLFNPYGYGYETTQSTLLRAYDEEPCLQRSEPNDSDETVPEDYINTGEPSEERQYERKQQNPTSVPSTIGYVLEVQS